MRENLITVEACWDCNNAYSTDDEYFRVAVAVQGATRSSGLRIWKDKVVGSSFRRSAKLRSAVAQTLFPMPVVSPAGLYLGNVECVTFDSQRVNRVIEKIVRGLYRHHHPEVLLGAEVRMDVDMVLGNEVTASVCRGLRGERVGGDVFCYWRGVVDDVPQESCWVLAFYLRTFFSVHTYLPIQVSNGGA